MEDEKNSMENEFQQVFGWFIVTNRISGNDFTKHQQIYQTSINEILNQLSFLIQYDREQEKQIKKMQSRQ